MLGNRCGMWMAATWAIVLAISPAHAVEPAAVEPLTSLEVQRYAELDARKIQGMTNVDLAEYVRLRARDRALQPQLSNTADEIGHYALQAIDQPYRLQAWRHDLTDADCVTFLERCISLALAEDWQSYLLLTDRLRHKDGNVKYAARNVYPLADWVPNNAWLFEDITDRLAVPVSSFDLGIERKKRILAEIQAGRISREDLTVDVDAMPAKELLPQTFTLRADLELALPSLRTGDLAFVIRKKEVGGLLPWYYSDHMGLIVVSDKGEVTFVHAAPPRVRQEPLGGFLRRCTWVGGLKFLRLRENAREFVKAELELMATKAAILTPAEQDAKNRALRSAQGLPLRSVDER